MGWTPKPKVKVSLFTCGTCKKPYNNRLTHVCRISFRQATGHRLPGAERGTRGRKNK